MQSSWFSHIFSAQIEKIFPTFYKIAFVEEVFQYLFLKRRIVSLMRVCLICTTVVELSEVCWVF